MPNFSWRLKAGPLIKKGRIQHAIFGAGVVLGAGFGGKWLGANDLLHYAQWGMVFVFFFALFWEGFTPWLVKRFSLNWDHPYGDFPDWMAYFIGAAIPLFILSLL